MDIIKRAKDILVTPKTAWNTIAEENQNQLVILVTYLIPLALIPALASFIGYGIIGHSVMGIHVGSVGFGLRQAILSFISSLAGVYLSAWVISLLSPKFELTKDFNRAFQLVSYSYTPIFVAGILLIIPSLSIVATLAGLYGLYLLYQGMTPILQTPEDKKNTFFIVSLLSIIVASVLVSTLLSALIIKPYSFL
ncbi:MAG: Yip1 family protein [Proteiniphilum sp.]|jgi:hypothetical protein|nr:Yip1 family protein [Proteiniphilum sp.]NCB25317.1 YIP1 family protein [Bacteroidia bacterium]MDD2937761.1 Yip1 family protein [Proteiniphilum sp.]MDD3075626.1 Yip1 family protein [Proteiniphilum sp.]MDD3778804.1 Yip1 family protein [Proteiniphilum sp.]